MTARFISGHPDQRVSRSGPVFRSGRPTLTASPSRSGEVSGDKLAVGGREHASGPYLAVGGLPRPLAAAFLHGQHASAAVGPVRRRGARSRPPRSPNGRGGWSRGCSPSWSRSCWVPPSLGRNAGWRPRWCRPRPDRRRRRHSPRPALGRLGGAGRRCRRWARHRAVLGGRHHDRHRRARRPRRHGGRCPQHRRAAWLGARHRRDVRGRRDDRRYGLGNFRRLSGLVLRRGRRGRGCDRADSTGPPPQQPPNRLSIVAFVLAAIALIILPIVFGVAGIACAAVALRRGERLGKIALIVAIAATALSMIGGIFLRLLQKTTGCSKTTGGSEKRRTPVS